MPQGIEPRLTLLNQPCRRIRIEVGPKVIGFPDRRFIFIAKPQIESEFGGDTPVILRKRSSARPEHPAVCVSDKELPAAHCPCEEVLQAGEVDSATTIVGDV